MVRDPARAYLVENVFGVDVREKLFGEADRGHHQHEEAAQEFAQPRHRLQLHDQLVVLPGRVETTIVGLNSK